MSLAIKLIALDLDGTLSLDNHQVSPATRDALAGLHNDGVEVVIATGRRYRTSRYVIDNLGIDTYCVCNGGALVKDHTQTTILESTMSAEDLSYLVKTARQYDIALSAQRDAHSRGGPDLVIDNVVTWGTQAARYFADNQQYAEAKDLLHKPDNYLVLGCFDEEHKLKAYQAQIQREQPGFDSVVVPHIGSDHFYLEVTVKAINKWHGLSHLAQHFNLDAENICAVGDQMNDYAMVQAAGHGIAMGNGSPALQAIADMVCGHHDADGLLDVVRYIRNHNEQHG